MCVNRYIYNKYIQCQKCLSQLHGTDIPASHIDLSLLLLVQTLLYACRIKGLRPKINTVQFDTKHALKSVSSLAYSTNTSFAKFLWRHDAKDATKPRCQQTRVKITNTDRNVVLIRRRVIVRSKSTNNKASFTGASASAASDA